MQRPQLIAWPVGLFLSLSVLASPTTGQFGWVQAKPKNSPGGLDFHTMVYDPGRRVTLLFGGVAAKSTYQNKTWEWDGNNWTLRNPITSPTARTGTAMAYDSNRKMIVLFGGNDSRKAVGDTWGWDGNNWKRLANSGPSPRYGAAMAFDAARNHLILFGGKDGFNSKSHSDTWMWNGTKSKWTKLRPCGSLPSARSEHGLVYDEQRRVCVLFGGGAGKTAFGDTWEWNGSGWTDRKLKGPGVRYVFAMAYDDTLRRVFLFGGATAPNKAKGETWTLDAKRWTKLKISGPSPRRETAGAYDSARRQFVIYGGWDLKTRTGGTHLHGGSWETLEAGCTTRTTAGPHLTGTGGRLGTVAKVTLTNGPGSAGIGVFLLGLEPMPHQTRIQIGCGGLMFTPIFAQAVWSGNPTIQWSVAVPNLPIYRYVRAYWQVVVIEPKGVSLSNALVFVVR